MELAYRLAVEDSPIISQIRDNVIVTITPVADPDGRDRNVDWYYRHPRDRRTADRRRVRRTGASTSFTTTTATSIIRRSTMRSLLDWYLQCHPPIMHDLHESQPLLYTFSGQAPQNPTLDPILYGELPMVRELRDVADDEVRHARRLDARLRGHVVAGISGLHVVESQRHDPHVRDRSATAARTTMKRTDRSAGAGGGEGGAERRRSDDARMVPAAAAYREVDWSMRNNTNYMQTGVLAALQLRLAVPEDHSRELLRKVAQLGRGRREGAAVGYVIPGGQRDMTRVALHRQPAADAGHRGRPRDGEVKLQEGTFPAGSFVIKRDQPYGRLAKILLEKQDYPDPNLRTYDDSGWTMGLMSHAEVKEIADKAILDLAVDPVNESEIVWRARLARQRIGAIAVAHIRLEQHDHAALPLQGREGPGRRRRSSKQGDVTFPAGSFIVAVKQAARRDSEEIGDRTLGLTAVALACAAGRADARCGTAAAGDLQPVGQARRKSAGCGMRSTSSRCPTT